MKFNKKKISVFLSTVFILSLILSNVTRINAATLENLALGKAVTINDDNLIYDKLVPIANAGTDKNKASMLTDGVFGDIYDWTNANVWFKFHRGMSRDVVVDLGEVNTVNSISMGMGQSSSVGIYPSRWMKVYVSNDGVDYKYLGKAVPDYPTYAENIPVTKADGTATANGIQRKVLKMDKLSYGKAMNIQARYVKVTFLVWPWVFADEIEVLGQKGIVNEAGIPQGIKDDNNWDINEFPAADSKEAAQLKDQFLFYTGKYSNPDLTNWTKDRVETVLGYKDINGDIKDWQFTELLVLPTTAAVTPSNQANSAKRWVTKGDLNSFLDFIFTEDETQLSAINKVAGELNKKFKTDKKIDITIAIPFIEKSSNFGDIKGDGSVLSLDPKDFASFVKDPNSMEGKVKMSEMAIENRIAATKWYIDEVEKRFKEAGYKNLNLHGYYWFAELIEGGQGFEETIMATSQYLKDSGRYFTWIPYQGPHSALIWKELGFSTMSLQYGYAFTQQDKKRIDEVVELAKKVGASVEIEYDNYATLAKYLNAGLRLGYMKDTYHTYYYGGSLGIIGAANQYNTENNKTPDPWSPLIRNVYDRTYEFIKGTYKLRYASRAFNNIADKNKMTSTVSLLLADNFVYGNMTLLYDPQKEVLKDMTLGASMANIGTVTVTTHEKIVTINADGTKKEVIPEDKSLLSKPGTINIKFNIFDAKNALNGEAKKVGQYIDPNANKSDIVNFVFSKDEGVKDSDIPAYPFVIDREGKVIDKDGLEYLNWSESSIIPGSLEEKIVEAVMAVRQAESTESKVDIDKALELINKLPESQNKKDFSERIKAITHKKKNK